MERISGHIERITFQSQDTGFTVARLKEAHKKELTLIVGAMPSVHVGVHLECHGDWKMHPSHGLQFSVSSFQTQVPSDVVGIEKYLASGLVKGIGPVYAERIVKTFGTDTLNVIDESPEKLSLVPGIGKGRLEQLIVSWTEHRTIRNVMIFLQNHGISPKLAHKIYKNYGEDSISIIKENPYQLSESIWGIGFKTADTIALELGLSTGSEQRVAAGIQHALREHSKQGHVCFPSEDFSKGVANLLELEEPVIQTQVERLLYDGTLVQKQIEGASFLWLKAMSVCEEGIGLEINRLLALQSPIRFQNVDPILENVQASLGINLAENQEKAVRLGLQEKVMIITGGPGTGKSTITNTLLDCLATETDSLVLAAPTGRAAKRMAEITGKKATTIHSLLSYDFSESGFRYNRSNPLSCQLLLVDEASMIDTSLMYSLLQAVPDHARLIFVGDVNQLPSVGPGNVLSDLIESKKIPVVQLTEIFRQAAGSKIITNSHHILKGVMPSIENDHNGDFFFVEQETPEQILETIVGLIEQRLPQKYGYHPMQDIQVLTPQNIGVIGTLQLNADIQNRLNPNPTRLQRDGREFRVGDKVMQWRNNYVKEVFNGDLGYIQEIDIEGQLITVNMDGRDVLYESTELEELNLAYAVTIHKFQGSEYPCVIMPVHTTHYRMLSRNLLYTGVTRGKQLVVLVGTKKALSIAVQKEDSNKRYTGLYRD